MAFGTQDEPDEVMNEINMTPLVDVMLVLLIIFIITVPVMKHAVNIDLPQATSEPEQTKPQNILFTVAADGSYYWNENRIEDSALAPLPSGVFAANSAWLVTAVMAYNLTRTAGTLAAGRFGKARTGTIRRKLIHVPARIATSARRIRLHLPKAWPWQTPWRALFDILYPPLRPA